MDASPDISPNDASSAEPDPAREDTAFLRELWYLALPGHRLQPGQHMAKTLLGEPLLIGRDASGGVFALRDVCPHRAMPLSYGRFDGESVECPYHGWRFGTDGECRLIPSLVDGQHFEVERIRVHAYPCEEVQGNIWIFFGERPDAVSIPAIPGLGNVRYRLAETVEFPCALDHAVVGLMDPAHGPFVHRAWWWRTKTSKWSKMDSKFIIYAKKNWPYEPSGGAPGPTNRPPAPNRHINISRTSRRFFFVRLSRRNPRPMHNCEQR